MHRAALAAAAVTATTAAAVVGVLPASALAAPTGAAGMTCGGVTREVTGFGRGQVLHVVGGTGQFVVTRAVLLHGEGADDDQVVFDNPGLAGRASMMSCTVTSTVGEGRAYALQGFFTPRG